MGMIARLLGREERAAGMTTGYVEMLRGFFAGSATAAGMPVNSTTALGVSTILDGSRIISEDVAGLPLGVYLREGPRRVPRPDDWLQYLLDRPNEFQAGGEFREQMTMQAVLTGNAVAIKVRVRDEIRELLPLAPGWYDIEQNDDWGVKYHLRMPGLEDRTLNRAEVFHLRGPSWSGFSGLNVVHLAREAIGLSMATEQHHSKLHSNGSRPGGILTTDSQLSEATLARLKTQWEARYGGNENAFKTAVLEQGLKWQSVAMTGLDAQHLETRKFQIEECCRFLRIFPQMVGHAGEQSATFASAEQFFLAHVKYSLLPWVRRWEDAIGRDLIGRRNLPLYVKHSVQALERADIKTRYEAYKLGLDAGWLLRSDARELEDMPPVDGLDRPTLPLNTAVLDADGNPPPKTPPAATSNGR